MGPAIRTWKWGPIKNIRIAVAVVLHVAVAVVLHADGLFGILFRTRTASHPTGRNPRLSCWLLTDGAPEAIHTDANLGPS